MSNGALGKVLSVGGSYVEAYQVPASGVQFTTCFIYVLNLTGTPATIKVAASSSNTPSDYEHIQGDLSIDANGGTYEFPALILSPGEYVMVYSDVSGLAISVRGMEQT